MKTLKDILRSSIIKNAALGWMFALAGLSATAQPTTPGFSQRLQFAQPGTSVPRSSTSQLTNAPFNYLVRVEWRETNSPSGAIELLTGEGQFQVSSSLPGLVASGEPAPATPVSLNGTLTVLNSEQGQLQLFLGRNVSYHVSGPGQKEATMQQRQEGLTVNFYVTFGKSVVVRKDVNGEVWVLVKKQAP